MKERPILFKGEMVRAILEGRKSVTRRVVKPQPPMPPGDGFRCHHAGNGEWFYQRGDIQWQLFKCPFGKPGDQLWVRETVFKAVLGGGKVQPRYSADGMPCYKIDTWVWKRNVLASIHLPYGASRVTLEITDVRVERLKSISEEDARAEGMLESEDFTPRGAFKHLWNSLAKSGTTWDDNPWVWVISFKRILT